MTNRSDVIAEHRREEQSKFRTRLLLGKNVQLKEMYERAVGESTPESKPLSPDEIVKSDTAKGLKELFEKGEFKDGTKSESKLEGEVFESAIAKQSRQLFRELDKGAASQTSPPMNPTPKPKRIDRTESLTVRIQIQTDLDSSHYWVIYFLPLERGCDQKLGRD